MEKDIKEFLEEDDLDFSKLLANSAIFKNGSKETYQASAKLLNENDISYNATKTIHWIANIYNQPLGYPSWFMAAYPDVVKWFSSLEESEIASIIGVPDTNYLDENGKFVFQILRKIVDTYKINNNLECSS